MFKMKSLAVALRPLLYWIVRCSGRRTTRRESGSKYDSTNGRHTECHKELGKLFGRWTEGVPGCALGTSLRFLMVNRIKPRNTLMKRKHQLRRPRPMTPLYES